jgi:hypothetical protein
MRHGVLVATFLLLSTAIVTSASPAEHSNEPEPTDVSSLAGGATDLAVTDIFLDRLRNGNLWVRVTNRGPHAIHGRLAEFIVVVDGRGLLLSGQLNVAPGRTQTLNTGMRIDASQRTRDITVTVRVPGMRDLKPSNNTYRERVP